MNDELNPDHPVTTELRGSWHKILFFVMKKLGADHVQITAEDIHAATAGPEQAIVTNQKDNSIHVSIVSMEDAIALARGGDH
jgi:phosphoribosyl-dephospho-CoA transferase